jgi:hypothetical protein
VSRRRVRHCSIRFSSLIRRNGDPCFSIARKPRADINRPGLRLVRTAELAKGKVFDLPVDGTPSLAQQFIDTGRQFATFRSLRLLGERLYQSLVVAAEPHPDLNSPEIALRAIAPAPSEDGEVMDFARRLAAVFNTMPLLGLNIVNEKGS